MLRNDSEFTKLQNHTLYFKVFKIIKP